LTTFALKKFASILRSRKRKGPVHASFLPKTEELKLMPVCNDQHSQASIKRQMDASDKCVFTDAALAAHTEFLSWLSGADVMCHPSRIVCPSIVTSATLQSA